MNSGAVTCVALDINFAASHCISCRVSDAAVNDYFSVIHCVSARILRIAVDGDLRTVEVSAECIARYSVNRDTAFCESVGDESLTQAVLDFAIVVRVFYKLIEGCIIKPFCIYQHIISHLLFQFKVFVKIFLLFGKLFTLRRVIFREFQSPSRLSLYL